MARGVLHHAFDMKRSIITALVITTSGYFGFSYYKFVNTYQECKLQTIYLDSLNDLSIKQMTEFRTDGIMTGIQIFINGKIDGTGTLTIGNTDSTTYKVYELTTGIIDLEHSGDWYSNVCYVTFKPTDPTTGGLEISCHFIETNEGY